MTSADHSSDDSLSIDEGERKYYSMIPNMITDIGLSPYAGWLYVRIKRRTGEVRGGLCYESTRNLAQGCHMSPAQVSRAKKELVEKGLITIKKEPGKHGEFSHDSIAVVEKWKENIEKYSSCSYRKQEGFTKKQEGFQEKLKNNPIKEEQKEEELHIQASPEYVASIDTQKSDISPQRSFSNYPKDTRAVLQEICSLWSLALPPKERRSQWIKEARVLNQACGEFGLEVIKNLHFSWQARPFDVGHPGALVNSAMAEAAKLRRSQQRKSDFWNSPEIT